MNYFVIGLVGLVSGVIGGLFGVGGGIIMVPAMHLLLNLNFKMAVGTSLLIIVPIALMGAGKHYTLGNVNWKVAALIAPLAVVGSWLGAKLTVPISAEHLRRSFGIFIICVGIYMTFFQNAQK